MIKRNNDGTITISEADYQEAFVEEILKIGEVCDAEGENKKTLGTLVAFVIVAFVNLQSRLFEEAEDGRKSEEEEKTKVIEQAINQRHNQND